MEILRWKIDSELKNHLDNHYQAKESVELKSKTPAEIIGIYTFSYGAPQLTLEGATKFLHFVEKLIGKKLSGIGVELGAGPGTHTALLANEPNVKKVYGVEASESIVLNLMPIIVPYIAKENSNKVVGVVGEFENLELPNNSVDFVFDFFSLHHTSDLQNALKEINRILKPGGFLFCFDKAREDSLNEEDLKKLLETEYPAEFKKKMGIPPDRVHTRRMNGENEYRRKDWLKFLKESEFRNIKHYNIAKVSSNSVVIKYLKTLFSILPFRLQLIITSMLPLKPTSFISPKERIYSKLVNFYQKEISLLIGYK